MKTKFIAMACAFAAAPTFALQIVEPVEGQNAFVKISAKENTRLYIEGGKIRTLLATDGELTVEKDDERGQLFIRPIVLDKPVNVRIISASGSTYNLVMQAVDIPQEDIGIRESVAVRADRAQAAGSSGKKATGNSIDRAVRSLVAAMALEEPPAHVDVRPTKQVFELWENTHFMMTAVYNEREFVGEKFVLTNTGKTPMRLAEQELYRKGVIAVAIENMQLEPGQSTNIYVVRSN